MQLFTWPGLAWPGLYPISPDLASLPHLAWPGLFSPPGLASSPHPTWPGLASSPHLAWPLYPIIGNRVSRPPHRPSLGHPTGRPRPPHPTGRPSPTPPAIPRPPHRPSSATRCRITHSSRSVQFTSLLSNFKFVCNIQLLINNSGTLAMVTQIRLDRTDRERITVFKLFWIAVDY